MNLSTITPIRRIVIGVAICSATATGLGVVALVTQPASSSSPDMNREVTYLNPVADDTVVVPGTIPVEEAQAVEADADRAEVAASRAEVAAGRAEVAATKVETVVTSTTTTTVAPTTTSTVATKPILVDVSQPASSTTTTTAAPKQWVEIARVPAVARKAAAGTPLQISVALSTGRLRVTMPHLTAGGFPQNRAGDLAVWLGEDPVPSQAYPATSENPGTTIAWTSTSNAYQAWAGPWPTGAQILSVGQNSDSGWVAPWWTDGDLIIEEYR